MSTQPVRPEDVMVDPEDAYAYLHRTVYAPVFFEKLAQDYGISPQSPEDAVKMMTLASQLRQAEESQQVKSAAEGDPVLSVAGEHLSHLMGGPSPSDTENQDLIFKAAQHLSEDPAVAASVLSLQTAAALAEQEAA